MLRAIKNGGHWAAVINHSKASGKLGEPNDDSRWEGGSLSSLAAVLRVIIQMYLYGFLVAALDLIELFPRLGSLFTASLLIAQERFKTRSLIFLSVVVENSSNSAKQ